MRHVAAVFALGFLATALRADSFDNYTNPILAKVPASKGTQSIKKLTPDAMVEHSRALPGMTAAFVVIKTNEGRLAKLLVQPAKQKISAEESAPILLIERYVTFREGEEKTVHAKGENVRLFDGFRFNLDMGQVVPEKAGGDIRIGIENGEMFVEPVGKAEMFLVTKHLPEANPKKSPRPTIGEKFEPRFFNGTYKLHDDGRRSGTLKLTVTDDGIVSGYYYSGKDGQKYEVAGKVENPPYTIKFRVTFPRTIQDYSGFMFTGDGSAIAGTSRLQDRETGFYAVRLETE